MNLKEWKSLCRKAWKNESGYLQIDKIAKTREGRYTKRNCNKTTYAECILETKHF